MHTKSFNISGFWTFDWLFGTSKIGIGEEDLYGPQDGQFMIFGSYPHSRSRLRERSSYENTRGKPISEEEKKARLEGLARVAQANYEQKMYEETYYGTGKMNQNKVYPRKNSFFIK
jgi:hypothetical protein